MGFLDSLESMAAQQMENSGNPTAKVAGGLMAALEEHPGGLQGVMNHMQQNGVDTQAMATGETTTTTPEQVQQGLQGSGLLESVAEKAGVSPQVAQMALATILPMVISHFTQSGQAAPPTSGLDGMASQILGKFL